MVTGGTSSATGTISDNTDVTEFDLDADFEEIIPNHCGLFLYDTDGRQTQELHPTNKGAFDEGFYLNNVTGTITITGSPTADDWTLRYIPRKTEITTGTQNLVIPDRLKHKCKRIFFHALSEMYKMRDERSAGDIQPDQVYQNKYYEEFVRLFQPNVKTISLNTTPLYYNSRYARRNLNQWRR